MDISSIELPGSEVESILVEQDQVVLRFSRTNIVKTMTGSTERTKWRQAGKLIFEGAIVTGEPPECPAICEGGDVGENIYTYRDMIQIPLQGKGPAHCDLRFEGTERRLVVHADSVKLEMEDRPRYVEHIRPQ